MPRNPLITLVGYGLIAIGAWIALAAVWLIYDAYQAPARHPFMVEMKGALAAAPLFSQAGGPPFVIEQGGATIIAVILLILLASCGVRVGIRLLTAGVQILAAPNPPAPPPPRLMSMPD